MKNFNNQSGRSMIEMLGVLAIIGVLSVGGIAGYSKAMLKFKINKTIDQISMTVTNIRTLYAQQPNYHGLTHELAYNMGIIDDAMKGSGSSIVNPFGGTVEIAPAASDAQNSEGAFIVTINGLPKEACVAVATNDWGSNYSSGLLGIGVGASPATCMVGSANDTSNSSVACAGNNRMAAYTVANAASACANGNYVAFKYY